ncbi:MAG: hypothetical protein GF388_10150 [Candidatus Aegiribacteria sp.]|nr:hypothetical protein [Candidatus Aegiribacteria sp.]MBD3295394.1 hypothetical protein [Candidatus Fermentibacteria bacterium]
MGRISRLDWKDSVHHVMTRGIEKRRIFEDDEDRLRFIDRLSKCINETDVTIYAWALMPNHMHYLIRTGRKPLSKFMHKLLTGHAVYFNKKYDRSGHLFQNRYKSILVQSNRYMLGLVRYIHLNPLNSNLLESMEELDEYPWTGHSCIMETYSNPWQDTSSVLNLFSGHKRTKIKQYRNFLLEKVDSESSENEIYENGSYLMGSAGLLKSGDNKSSSGEKAQYRILGDYDFAMEVYHRMRFNDRCKLRDRNMDRRSIEVLISYVEDKYNISKTALRSSSKRKVVSNARSLICYVMIEILGMKYVDCGNLLNISPQAAIKAARRCLSLDYFKKDLQYILDQIVNS